MIAWLRAHAPVVEALGAMVTASAALAALVFVPWQIAQNDRIQREQAAREMYREFLNITIQQASVATQTACTVAPGAPAVAYAAYVEYLIYTAEQVLSIDPEGWSDTMHERMIPHRTLLCQYGPEELSALDAPAAALIVSVTGDCADLRACPEGQP